MDQVLRIAGHNFAVPAALLDAIPEWWQELVTAAEAVKVDQPAYLAVPYGSSDRLMACEDEDDTPFGWWARFRLRSAADGNSVELTDVLTGQRYDATLLVLFFRGLIATDVDDSLEVLQVTQQLHEHLYGCSWEGMPSFQVG